MIHQPSGGSQGKAEDILISAKTHRTAPVERMYELYVKHSGQDHEDGPQKALDRDQVDDPRKRRRIGAIIDEIVESRGKEDDADGGLRPTSNKGICRRPRFRACVIVSIVILHP